MINKCIILLGFLLLTACGNQPPVFAYEAASITPNPGEVLTLTPTTTISPVPSATNTQTPTLPPTSTPSPAPSPTATQETRWNPPGSVIAPILLYHHVAESNPPLRYYVPPAEFQKQMDMIKEKGYTTISLSKLQEAFISGTELPLHPIVITFDDGALDVYTTAFPIMKKLGFTGTFYIPVKYLNGEGFVTSKMVEEMIGAGWQIGSHSWSHTDLTKSNDTGKEIIGSREFLEEKLGTPIDSFAYPFGSMSEGIINTVKKSGYINAVGLGFYSEHASKTEHYLSRMEIKHSTNMDKFEKMITTLMLLNGSTVSYLDIR